MPKKLPIGIQTFREIREDNYLYVDKTKQIHELVTVNKVYFISRPRRFGKSLLISTLEEVFKGNKELFKGLDIYQEDYNWKKYPIIRISFGGNLYENRKVIENYVNEKINEISENYKIEITEKSSVIASLRELIRKLSEIDKVVILIDEYDKPLIDNLTQDKKNIFIENREFLKAFYSVFKEMDEYLKFVLLTGVSKFSKAGVFSGLNQLQDITMDERFADLLGWTQLELENNFKERIKDLTKKENLDQKQTIEKIKHWYNGYQFSKDQKKKVYNPFSSLLLFQKQDFSFYWFESGTPSFLINLIRDGNLDIKNLDNLKTSESAFSTYEIENLKALPLLFQTGYLTIKDYDDKRRMYVLNYPNYEVKNAFLERLAEVYTKVDQEFIRGYLYDLIDSLEENNLNNFFEILRTFFANISFKIQIEAEKYYQTIFYIILKLLGLEIKVESQTNLGSIDAVIEVENGIYIFEFKIFDTKENAMQQIKNKKYYEKYLLSGSPSLKLRRNTKKIYLVGVEFSESEENKRNIGGWVVEELKNKIS